MDCFPFKKFPNVPSFAVIKDLAQLVVTIFQDPLPHNIIGPELLTLPESSPSLLIHVFYIPDLTHKAI